MNLNTTQSVGHPTNQYSSYCWFLYPVTSAVDRTPLGGTVCSLFPPNGRNSDYGGLSRNEIRSLAFERLGEVERVHGSGSGRVEMID